MAIKITNNFGIYSKDEQWKDYRDYYRNIVDGVQKNTKVTVEEAKEKLRFYKKFDPTVKHDRLVGNIINVYRLYNPKWTSINSIYFTEFNPKNSNIENILSVDIGQELKNKKPEFKLNDYITTTLNPNIATKEVHYSFDFKKDNFTENTHLFVIEYLEVDGFKFSEEKSLVRAGFSGYNELKRFKKFHFEKGSIDYL